MTSNRLTARLGVALTLAVVLTTGLLATAASAQDQNDQYVELLRQDLRTNVTAVMTESMALTSAQGEVFWPIFREYQHKVSELGDKRLALIKDYAASYESMDGDIAADIMKKWFKQEKEQLKLLEKAAKKIAKELDPVVAARFVQVDNAMNMIVDLQLASEIPLFSHGTVE